MSISNQIPSYKSGSSDSDTSANGHAVTVASLAKAKRLDPALLSDLDVADLPGGGISIPYFDSDGTELFCRERDVPGGPRFRQPAGVKLRPYGLWQLGDAARRAGHVYLAEGESDAWSLWTEELPALGIPGANSAGCITAEDLSGIDKIYLLPDADQAGEQLVEGLVRRLTELKWPGRFWRVGLPDGIKDVSDWRVRDQERFLGELAEAVKGAKLLGDLHDKDKKDKQGRPTQLDQLLDLASAAEYVHTAEGKAFALVNVRDGDAGHVETLSLRTKAFRNWLAREYYQATGKAASAKNTEDVLRVLEARANYDGDVRNVSLRVAEGNGTIYLDVGDSRWQAVAVDASGWQIVTTGAPLFRRPRGLLPLPLPVPGGNLDELRPFCNVTDADWPLVVAWLVQSLWPRGPYPVLCLHGEQGSAKSTTAKVLRSLIDPNAAPLRSQPRDERDLVIAANNSWIVTLDNLSHLDGWLSDALCRLSTGGGFGTRELYTDEDEIIFEAQRPLILTGIEDLATRGDLIDRSLLILQPQIDKAKRLPEAEFWKRFEVARPRLLGSLLDLLSAVLRELPHVRLPQLPRMADFALLGVACEKALRWKPGSFLAAYGGNRDDATRATLESSLIFPALEEWMESLPGRAWEGSCQELLSQLNATAGDKGKSKYWPATPRSLSGQLRRLAPSLRAIDVQVEFDRTAGKNSKRLVRITRVKGETMGNPPSQPTQPSHKPGREGDGSDASDGSDGIPPIDSPSCDKAGGGWTAPGYADLKTPFDAP
jgi:hypothetical protein